MARYSTHTVLLLILIRIWEVSTVRESKLLNRIVASRKGEEEKGGRK